MTPPRTVVIGAGPIGQALAARLGVVLLGGRQMAATSALAERL
jgi:hypothetical protein